jgi:uncharacterized membrane protein YphA (DoxX/SURF4 family)
MSLAYVIIGIVLAVALVGSGMGKITKAKSIVDSITSLGVPPGLLPVLAACEIAGALGLIVGIWWRPLGIAAAVGVVLYFIGAVGAHLRKRDFKGIPGAGLLLVVSAVTLALAV